MATSPTFAANQKKRTDMNGTWIIEAKPPAAAVGVCNEYLPTGTRVRLSIQGPTRLAIEAARQNELGAVINLLLPVSPAVCATGLGASTEFGGNVCRDGVPLLQPNAAAAPVAFDADVQFKRIDAAGIADPDNMLFKDLGAKAGASFMTVNVKYKAVSWRLWLRAADEMVSECVATMPGKNRVDSFPMVWRRQPES